MNRTPRKKKPQEQKSKVFHARLHPDSDAWVIETIERYKLQGIAFRELTIMGMSALEGVDIPTGAIPVNYGDVQTIKDTLQYLVNLIQSGEFSSKGTGKKGKLEKLVQLPKEITDTLNHYLGGGAVFDED